MSWEKNAFSGVTNYTLAHFWQLAICKNLYAEDVTPAKSIKKYVHNLGQCSVCSDLLA
jgi:hypothetical protein